MGTYIMQLPLGIQVPHGMGSSYIRNLPFGYKLLHGIAFRDQLRHSAPNDNKTQNRQQIVAATAIKNEDIVEDSQMPTLFDPQQIL